MTLQKRQKGDPGGSKGLQGTRIREFAEGESDSIQIGNPGSTAVQLFTNYVQIRDLGGADHLQLPTSDEHQE